MIFIIHHVQSGENSIFLTHQLLSQMEISGGKVEFQYLRRKLLASLAHLIEAACVLGQIRYISSVFLCPFGLFPSPFPQAIFLDKSRAVPVHISLLGVKSNTPGARSFEDEEKKKLRQSSFIWPQVWIFCD